MEFDEENDDEIMEEMPIATHHYDSLSNSASTRPKHGEGSSAVRKSSSSSSGGSNIRYRECLKNHAIGIGGHAVDGCGEFMPAGEEGSIDALKCAACNCHRNFHRKETDSDQGHYYYQQQQLQICSYRGPTPHPSAYVYLRGAPVQPRALALLAAGREEDDTSNPSSSGGGGGGGGGSGSGLLKKRFRTKFSTEQKEKMLGFAEKVGWTIQKHDEADVERFCTETGVRRQVLKVWMHNNKHTLGKKP
ncbi:zinc-finger homeodomain protein 2 [Benincasa hispida]|uniref:zinc-finger homeodomain protein 2 n=1 Tax=Benincasa hispida TaxID=102211 RepID=UPI001902A264|nr:zinc-finger homeodomain protein 2 [Benincasa hispida]